MPQARERKLAGILAAATAVVLAIGIPAPASATPGSHATPGCGQQPEPEPGTSTTRYVRSDGTLRSYVLHVPQSYRPDMPTPVILAFHGRKSTGAELAAYSGLSGLDAILAYPNGLPDDEGKTGWAGAPYSPEADDVQFVRDILAGLRAGLCVDKDRIFATGKSNGGGFAALLACVLPNRIAAFAPVAGAFYPQSTRGCHDGPPVPMLEFHGTDDPIMEYQGGESHGERFPSIPAWLWRWVRTDHCRTFDAGRIGADVTVLSWGSCAAGTNVVHYRIEGGGHTWPGELVDSGPGSATQTISATDVMWEFFLRHPLHPDPHPTG